MHSVWLLLGFMFWLCLAPFSVQAQHADTLYRHAVTVKFFGLSMHLKQSPHPEIFPNRVDEQGYLVPNYGLIVGYDFFIKRNVMSIRAQQGLYSDCAASLAGFTHIGWRGQIFQKGKHQLNGGIGPTLVYRRDWNRLKGYQDDGYFNRSGIWQYKFYLYGGEFEYNYSLTDQSDLSVNLVPGLPELIAFGIGVRHRF